MNIEQLLKMPVGQKTGGFLTTVKMAKKYWEVGKLGQKEKGRVIHQQAILVDETGEMVADIKINSPEHGNHDSLKKGQIIQVIVCEIQSGYEQKGLNPESQKKLFIDQYVDYVSQEPMTADEYYDKKQKEREKGMWQLYADENGPDIPGMCATHIIEGFINGYTAKHGEIPECTPERMKTINEWVAFNMNGRLAEAKGGDDNELS